MRVYKGLKNVIRSGKLPTQGSVMYGLVMCWLSRRNKPRWMNIIDKQVKRGK